MDQAATMETRIRRVLHETRGMTSAQRQEELRRTIGALLESVAPPDRNSTIRRLTRRHPSWFEAGESASPDPAVDVRGTAPTSVDATRQRTASLEREVRDLQATCADLREQLNQQREKTKEATDELIKKAGDCRQLEKRHQAATEKLSLVEEEAERVRGERQRQDGELQEAREERQRLNTKIIRLESQLHNTLRSQPPASGSALPPEPAPKPETKKIEPPPSPVEPPAPQAPGGAYGEFTGRMMQRGFLRSEEVKPATEALEKRVGAVTAELVEFQIKIEKIIAAQLETLGEKQADYRRFLQNLQALRTDERSWWRTVTYRDRKHLDVTADFKNYLEELSKLVFVMLTAYLNTLQRAVKKQAMRLTHPSAIRAEANQKRRDPWEVYEGEYADRIPNQMADSCMAELASVVRSLYDTDNAQI